MKKILPILLFLFAINTIKGQQVYERNSLEVHQFLATMSQKGYIEWNDLISPIKKDCQNLLLLTASVFDKWLLTLSLMP